MEWGNQSLQSAVLRYADPVSQALSLKMRNKDRQKHIC